ncbi:MAG: hypothetical protein IPN29_18900 [Saprospiraceae bacterium]|nr:hypothetical protein [Saprospiraceae bacterium]
MVEYTPSRAQESRAAIQRLYISMRHLFIRGSYKPLGVSGEAMIESMLTLKPEIYGSIADEEKVELRGLLYIFERLPRGIEECRYIRLISREGFEDSRFEAIVPSKRRRNCYHIDEEQMYIEMTRGASDIYDILTHITFMYIEAEKIRRNSLDARNRKKRSWHMLEEYVTQLKNGEDINREVGYTYLSSILGRTYIETVEACEKFASSKDVNSLFEIVYWLGRRSMEEALEQNDREISFSSSLREVLGHHVFGEKWANNIKQILRENKWLKRPIHIISANLHSVVNSLFASQVLSKKVKSKDIMEIAEAISTDKKGDLRRSVEDFARKNGMISLDDTSGTNIGVQIFDLEMIDYALLPKEIRPAKTPKTAPVLIVMDYAFGEQAYETLDELLKPMDFDGQRLRLNIQSVNIMGKAGILEGDKGDIMIPSAHILEGFADNYPLDNEIKAEDFANSGLGVYYGPMVTVLGTSLQNKDILTYFLKSSWGVVGLEMEGAHYQKAIQAHSKIRNNISKNVKLRYAYYASDNPLETGSTLASGSLGVEGVKPTYLITIQILKGILN